jgi:4-alpha-glucanotransferase
LEDYALFRALKTHFGGIAWHQWPHELRDREEHALAAARRELNPVVTFEQFLQYLFFSQWLALKDYCRQKGVRIIGDVPIYVTHDGVELWTNPACFKLDGDRNPVAVAGVPPDYFSATGQLWGNPVYDWETLRQSGYAWWLRRIEHNLRLVDVVRIDHFRGLVAFWEVKMPAATAVTGCWVEVPAWDFFHRLTRKFPCLPMVAEDLGTITADVREVMRHFDIPGMKVLLFGFGTDLPQNPYIPHNLPRDCVAYTGTHDNNTARGWFESEASPLEKENLYRYLGRHVIAGEVPWELIRLLMRSAAATVILPLQDVLALGSEARMNTPATTQGNWEWRVTGDLLTREVSGKLRAMTEITGRLV